MTMTKSSYPIKGRRWGLPGCAVLMFILLIIFAFRSLFSFCLLSFPFCRASRVFCPFRCEGATCNRCAPESFHLASQNPGGCLRCFCSGVTHVCESTHWRRSRVELDYARGDRDQLDAITSDARNPYKPPTQPQVHCVPRERIKYPFMLRSMTVPSISMASTRLGAKHSIGICHQSSSETK